MAAGTFTGVLAAIFLGTFPAISTIVKSLVGWGLQVTTLFAESHIGALELQPPMSTTLAQCLSVAAVVLLAGALLGLGRGLGLLGQLTFGLLAGFLATITLIVTFLALPQDKTLDLTLLPVAVALMGVTVVLATALERASSPQ